MLLVIDVGNTNITLGVFNKDELFGTFRMKTKQPRTSDEIFRRKAGGCICRN